MINRSNKKLLSCVLAILLLLVAVFFVGGCGGSSSRDSAQRLTIPVVGEIAADDRATFEECGIDLVDYSETDMLKCRAIILSGKENVTNEQWSDIDEMFEDDDYEAAISLYEPTVEEIKYLIALLGLEESGLIQPESFIDTASDDYDTEIRAYTVWRDKNGNVNSYAELEHGTDSKYQIVRNDSISSEDVKNGYVWVKFNDANSSDAKYDVITYDLKQVSSDIGELYYLATEKLIASVGEDAISIDMTSPDMKVKVSDDKYLNALSVRKKEISYGLKRSGIEIPADMQTQIKTYTNISSEDQAEIDLKNTMLAREATIESLAEWFLEDYKDEDMLVATSQAESKKGDIFAISKQEAHTKHNWDAFPGLKLVVHTYIASAHKFMNTEQPDGGTDYYFIKQFCNLNNSISGSIYDPYIDKKDGVHKHGYDKQHGTHWYRGGFLAWYETVLLKEKFRIKDDDGLDYWIGGAEIDEFYSSEYTVGAELVGPENDNISCINPQPQTHNKQTEVKISHGWKAEATATYSIGGDKGGGISLTGGFHSEKEEKYTTTDFECKLSNIEDQNLKWTYFATKKPERGSPLWKLTNPVALSRGGYVPIQSFIWTIPTNLRNKYNSMRNSVSAVLEGCYSTRSGSATPRYNSGRLSWEGAEIALPKPPLFCVSATEVNFDETTVKGKVVNVYSQGAWELVGIKYITPANPTPWLTITRTNNAGIMVDPKANDTGDTRSAQVTLRRIGGTEKWDTRVITVTQSRHSK